MPAAESTTRNSASRINCTSAPGPPTHGSYRSEAPLGSLIIWRLRTRACSDAGWNIDPLPARQDDVARDYVQLPFLAAVSLNHILGAYWKRLARRSIGRPMTLSLVQSKAALFAASV